MPQFGLSEQLRDPEQGQGFLQISGVLSAMSYASVAQTIVNHVRAADARRILSLDIETRVRGKDSFLTGETILGVSAAWREDGEARSEVLILTEETDTAEAKLLRQLDNLLLQLRPLILVGYYLTHYDVPLLNLKARRMENPLWGISDTISRAHVLDLKDPVRFELASYDRCSPKSRSLDSVVEHPRFSHLPLMRTKRITRGLDRTEKGEAIYLLWKENREKFELYSRGDAYDTLLIFEELFPVSGVRRVLV